MASKPGVLTDWPWKPLGSFKYIILAPWAIYHTHQFIFSEAKDRDLSTFLVLPFILWRMLHNQIWISLSRYRTAKGNNRILDKGIEFEQVDREGTWDDQIIFTGLLFYIGTTILPWTKRLPIWRTDGVMITLLLHAGPVEFLYYWLHRALHHHFLYLRYHSHHHSSIVTEPITSVVHPFAEHIAYFTLFAIPMLTTVFTGTASVASLLCYINYIDLMNNLGHCNFEFVPKWLFSCFPPLKYLMYTPSFHSLHHTQFRANYSLFMPIYDYIYGTMDKTSDQLYETSLRRGEELPDVVYLTHLTTPESIYQLQLGFASVASRPYGQSTRFIWLLGPMTLWSMMLTWIYGRTFIVERNRFNKLKLQTWAIPKYNIQYDLQWKTESINVLIEEAILDADRKGSKVLTLGLLNQESEEELNGYGQLYVQRYQDLKVKVVDGSGLAVAVVLNSIPKDVSEILLRGNLSKVACAIAFALCRRGIQVTLLHEHEYQKLSKAFNSQTKSNLSLSSDRPPKVWLVGDGLTKEEQMKAPKGTLFIPFSQFPPKKARSDCFYHVTPAMTAPKSLENVHSCENWLPRRAMSAWRIAGIIHALEGYNEHECGYAVSQVDKVWQASLCHGFQPLGTSIKIKEW